MLHLVRYEDGTDRCPDCAAIVPEPEDLDGGGTLRRPVEHRAWCPRLRLLEPNQANKTLRDVWGVDADQPPAPGPIWSNSLAAEIPHAVFTAAELATAERTLAYFRGELEQHWEHAALHYVTADLESDGTLTRTSSVLLHVIAKELHHG